MTCLYACGSTDIMSKDLKTHCDSTCQLLNVPCPFVEMGCVHHSIPHKQLTTHLLCGVPGHTVGLLESNQTVKETVAEMYEKFSKAIREMRESLALLEE